MDNEKALQNNHVDTWVSERTLGETTAQRPRFGSTGLHRTSLPLPHDHDHDYHHHHHHHHHLQVHHLCFEDDTRLAVAGVTLFALAEETKCDDGYEDETCGRAGLTRDPFEELRST